MNKEEEPFCTTTLVAGTKCWRLKNGKIHKLDGPAIIYSNDDHHDHSWRIYGNPVRTTLLELSVGQSISWNDDIALVINQINPILFQVLLGNQKEYLFCLANTKYELDEVKYCHRPNVSISYV